MMWTTWWLLSTGRLYETFEVGGKGAEVCRPDRSCLDAGLRKACLGTPVLQLGVMDLVKLYVSDMVVCRAMLFVRYIYPIPAFASKFVCLWCLRPYLFKGV